MKSDIHKAQAKQSPRVKSFLLILSGVALGVITTLVGVVILSPINPLSPVPSVCPTRTTLRALDENTVQSITNGNVDFKYLKDPDILVVGMAKSGTTSFWNWIYHSMKGQVYNCSRFVQSLDISPCWGDEVAYLFQLNSTERMRILTSPKTLRVALWRDPYERIISVWKSKITCEGKLFGTDRNGRTRVVRNLRKVANMSPALCLNISEFADSLDSVRLRIHNGITAMKKLDPHTRVQEHYTDFITYHSVFTVADATRDSSLLNAIVERMPYKDIARGGMPYLHGSIGERIAIPEEAAVKIAAFAALTKPRPQPLV